MSKTITSYQVASALYLGRRENQEDAIATDFAIGEGMGFAVISDGMGGHNAGEVASKVVVTEVFSELKLHSGRTAAMRGNIRDVLLNAAEIANACVGDVASDAPEAHGMGATLIVPVFVDNFLHWISIGDSPLYLHRKGRLQQINEDHSMAPHIDLMVRSGMIDETLGRSHPDRNCLTSVLVGRPISKIDCPEEPTQLFDGDIVIAASDGVQTLSQIEMQEILERHAHESSEKIAEEILHAIQAQDDPDQDNVSFALVKISETKTKHRAAKVKPKEKPEDVIVENDVKPRDRRRMPKLHAALARLLPAMPGAIK